jgi:hypothetical protein
MIMLRFNIYQGQVPDADVKLHVGDTTELELTVLDANGDKWPDSWTAELIVRRSNDDVTGEFSISADTEATPLDIDNIFYFGTAFISFESGTYTMFLRLTSLDATPQIVSFESFNLEVLE